MIVKILKLLPEATVGRVTAIVPAVAVKATVLPVTVNVLLPGVNVPPTAMVPLLAKVLAPVEEDVRLL